jgi:hypothetical protein
MAFVVCGVGMTCVYYMPPPGQPPSNLGHRQSADPTYVDGTTATPAVPAEIRVMIGAQSMCMNPAVTFAAGNYVTLTFDAGKVQRVYLSAFTGTDLTLYVSQNGSTYRDAALTMFAAGPPPPF